MTDSTSPDTRSSSDLRTSPDTRADDPADALLARLARLRTRVADLVERRSVGDPTADDPLRGLYLSDEAVRHHLRRLADPLPPEGDAGRGTPPRAPTTSPRVMTSHVMPSRVTTSCRVRATACTGSPSTWA